MMMKRKQPDPDVVWLSGILRRNPSSEHAVTAVDQLVARHGRNHVHRLLAIEYERSDGSRWRHEAGDRGDGVAPERRPEWIIVEEGQAPRFAGPMKWVDGRGLVG
jgi:hypothetical protein